jgi:hypothetical protein
MAKERVIFETLYDVEDWREGFKYWCNANDLDEDEEDIYDYIDDSIQNWLCDERINLNKPVDGDILVIADLGLWDGRHSAYQVIHATKLSDIFNIRGNYDDVRFYCDQHNVRADLYHHNGCNHVEFRLIKKGANIKPLTDKLYNQKEYTREDVRKCTTSLRKAVASIYGW